MKDLNAITEAIIGAAIEVHKEIGPGLLESTYEQCMCAELSRRKMEFRCQVPMPILYKGLRLDCAYRADLLVEDEVIVELKAVDGLESIHIAQVLSYLKAADKRLGLLINFNVELLGRGIKRVVNDYSGPRLSPRFTPCPPRLRGEEKSPSIEVPEATR